MPTPAATAPEPPAPAAPPAAPPGHPAPVGVGEPTPHAARSLAPDLARGMMLLLIALANVWGYLWGHTVNAAHRPVDGSTLDRVTDALVTFVADDRSRPMFAILFGYGMATMARRLAARGAPVGRTLVRRNLALVALGLVHSFLLFQGDILAVYGATGLLALSFLGRRRRALVAWFVVSSVVATAVDALLTIAGDGERVEAETGDYLAGALQRVVGTGVMMVIATVALIVVSQVVVGIWLARSGWLDRPAEHRAALRRVVGWAIAANVVGNLPAALAAAELWHPTGGTLRAVLLAHSLSGFAMGLGYICLFALLAARWGDRPRTGLVRAVSAVGERSLTSYLLQSVVLAPLLSVWGLGLGGRIGTAAAAAIAVGAWLVTVGVALMLDRAGRRGPFEVALRRLTYGRRHAPRGGGHRPRPAVGQSSDESRPTTVQQSSRWS